MIVEKFFEETREAVNCIPEILHCNMDSYVQHRITLHNAGHTYNVDAPLNGGDGAGVYEVLECDFRITYPLHWWSITGSFTLVKMNTRILKTMKSSGHTSMIY